MTSKVCNIVIKDSVWAIHIHFVKELKSLSILPIHHNPCSDSIGNAAEFGLLITAPLDVAHGAREGQG